MYVFYGLYTGEYKRIPTTYTKAHRQKNTHREECMVHFIALILSRIFGLNLNISIYFLYEALEELMTPRSYIHTYLPGS